MRLVGTRDLNIFGLRGAALAGVLGRSGRWRRLNPDQPVYQIRLQRPACRVAMKAAANSLSARPMVELEGPALASIAARPNHLDLAACVDLRTVRTETFPPESRSR